MNIEINDGKSYWSAAKAYGRSAIRMILADRGMLITDFFLATLVPYLAQYFVWTYIYSASRQDTVHGFGYSQLLFYYAYAIAIGRLNNGYDIVQHLSDSIVEGTLETQMLKPFAYRSQRLWDFLGGGLLYWLPVLIILGVQMALEGAGGALVAAGPIYWIGLFAIFLLSQMVCFYLHFTFASLSFYLVRIDIVLATVAVAGAFFGGALLPPAFWPDMLAPLMNYNPFRFMMAAPAELFTRPDAALMVVSLIALAGYTVLFKILASLMWHRGVRVYHGAGG